MSRRARSIALAALVSACGGAEGGSRPAAGAQEVRLPGLAFTARSQLWSPWYVHSIPLGLDLYLLEGVDACGDPDELILVPGTKGLVVDLSNLPVDGDCPVTDPWLDASSGCRATVYGLAEDSAWHGLTSIATAGTVHLDRSEDGRLKGRVRATFPPQPTRFRSCAYGGGGRYGFGYCVCEGFETTWTCDFVEAEEGDCCDDGEGTEVEIPFDAEPCAAVSTCWGRPCPPLALGDCRPPRHAAVDCATACAGHARVCASCSGCSPDDEPCLETACGSTDACALACASVLGDDPTFATALRCFERSLLCADWEVCMATCGRE